MEDDGDKAGAVVPVELRSRWLRRHPTTRPLTVINLDDERDYSNCFMSQLYNSPADPAARFVVSGQRVRTGHTFCVRVPEQPPPPPIAPTQPTDTTDSDETET